MQVQTLAAHLSADRAEAAASFYVHATACQCVFVCISSATKLYCVQVQPCQLMCWLLHISVCLSVWCVSIVPRDVCHVQVQTLAAQLAAARAEAAAAREAAEAGQAVILELQRLHEDNALLNSRNQQMQIDLQVGRACYVCCAWAASDCYLPLMHVYCYSWTMLFIYLVGGILKLLGSTRAEQRTTSI